jgi:hypothetical protein
MVSDDINHTGIIVSDDIIHIIIIVSDDTNHISITVSEYWIIKVMLFWYEQSVATFSLLIYKNQTRNTN